MKYFIGWVRSVRTYRINLEGVEVFVVADWGGWIPGSARTRCGAFLVALRAYFS